jgi:hypothetical protein
MSTNPFQSPVIQEESSVELGSTKLLASLRRAVMWAAAATILFTLGSVLSALTTISFYYRTFQSNVFDEVAQAQMATIWRFAIAQQLIMACGFGYLSWTIVNYAKSIRQATQREVLLMDKVLISQRSCWYSAATLSAIFIVLRLVSVVISE